MLALSAWVPGLTPTPDEYATPLQNAALYTRWGHACPLVSL